MKYLDHASLLEGDPAYIALFSTFQFDPDFFERRLLKCSTLRKARRIAVFMDGRQWQELLQRDVRARRLNRRYLVVPVHRSQGVFHPKLNLLLTDSGGQIQCGSNNLTRSGCSSNLELLNSIPFDFDEEDSEAMQLASASLKFFQRAAHDTDAEVGRIASDWLSETQQDHRWLKEYEEASDDQQLRLVHTYDGPIWSSVEQSIGKTPPKKFFIVSPFHDKDGGICKRLSQQWPGSQVEMLVQQGYTNLPVAPLRDLPAFKLSEIHNSTGKDASRRVHAKLFAWQSRTGGGCVVGSANFTSAAFEGRNIEACLLMHESNDHIEQLFDQDLSKRPLPLDEFDPGSDESPEPTETETKSLRLQSAILRDPEHLRVTFTHSLGNEVVKLRLAIRTPGEKLPRKTLALALKENATEDLLLPENTLADCKATILASLVADLTNGERVESLAVWIVQEDQLTHEPGGGSSTSKSRIEETGDGLPEYLEELGQRDGPGAIAEYLRHLNIRFNDGAGRRAGKRKFRIRISDPFQSDIAPDWLLNAKREADQVEQAIYDFVERHIKKKLKKHSERGNINGMENFLDIFTTLVKVLYRWYKLDVVKRGHLIGKLVTMLEVATSGKDTEKEWFDGYLYSVYDSISGDVDLLQEVCTENNYCGEIYAALLIVQMVRYQPGEVLYGKEIKRPKQALEIQSKMIREAVAECYLRKPSSDDVRKALESYRMLSEEEITTLLAEL
ncbi:hypothetical protein LOC67_20245 [Stieleria sp. JC731]|uniref:hypothetical protein n=1 Tax=Pirellulaceae TaxID=2691357 RepID=UPI001E39B89B|nr:hypothetical protein [Stieleria sp. JC731]MCC9602887.1 hypothetical protein [Stieleria sp. JC731]